MLLMDMNCKFNAMIQHLYSYIFFTLENRLKMTYGMIVVYYFYSSCPMQRIHFNYGILMKCFYNKEYSKAYTLSNFQHTTTLQLSQTFETTPQKCPQEVIGTLAWICNEMSPARFSCFRSKKIQRAVLFHAGYMNYHSI